MWGDASVAASRCVQRGGSGAGRLLAPPLHATYKRHRATRGKHAATACGGGGVMTRAYLDACCASIIFVCTYDVAVWTSVPVSLLVCL